MVSHFEHEGYRIAYEEFGSGDRPLVLLHGLLLSRRMHQPLAQSLAERGNRVITMDFLGHGDSDMPPRMSRYSMPKFGAQIRSLLDHLGLEQAVVGGTSLGANSTLELAAASPERIRGMVLEMPVLEHALIAVSLAFVPPAAWLMFGGPVARGVASFARAVPSRVLPYWTDVVMDVYRRDPAVSAAVLRGLFFGRAAPPHEDRRSMTQPALVIGHPRDPIHPFNDADMLSAELVNGERVDAKSIFELRFQPERLTGRIADFLDECWSTPARPKRRSRSSNGKRAAA